MPRSKTPRVSAHDDGAFWRPAIAIFIVALAVRLVHVWQIRDAPFFTVLMGDSRGYDEWAERIAAGDWIGRDVFYQAPLYPYFLGVVYTLAGRSLLLVRLVQIVIGSASCVLVGLAARTLFSWRAGVAAGLILALWAPAIFFDALLQKSVLDVFFVSLALWIVAEITETAGTEATDLTGETEQRRLRFSVSPVKTAPSVPSVPVRSVRSVTQLWLFLGLTIGALSLTRENALVFIAVIAAWALVVRKDEFQTRLRTAGAFAVGLAIVTVPVAVRNSVVGGGFYVTTAQFGPNFYIGNNPSSDGTYASLRYGRGAPEYERQDATDLAQMARGRQLTPAEVSSYWTNRALDFIASQPGAWLRLMARKAALLWNRAEMVDTEDQATYAEWSLPLRLTGPIANFGVLVPLAVFSLFATWPGRARLWPLYALLVAYAASVVLFYVFARYRYPLVPMLIVFAAAGLVDAPAWFARRSPRASLAVAAVVAAAIFANWPMLSTDLMRAVTENNLGTALQAAQRLDEATAHYQRAIALRSDYAPAYNNLGTALRAEGRVDDALTAYDRALRLQPAYPDAHFNAANALMDTGRSDAAVEHFQIALRSVPGSAEVHNNLGIALANRGRRDEAAEEFAAALRVDPSSVRAHRNLGDLLAATGRTNDAIDHFRRAAELAPDDGALHYDFGSVLLEAGRPTDAAAEFRAALRVAPASVEAHNNLGIALASQGKLNEAIAQFQEALRLNPNFDDARKNLQMARQIK